ncbi:natural cytotoxicity triggering receptor 3-like isoform 2-T2 [Pangshura tecta]
MWLILGAVGCVHTHTHIHTSLSLTQLIAHAQTHTHPSDPHPRPLTAAISEDGHKTFHHPLGLTLPEDAEAELSWPHGAAQRAGTVEQLPALSTVLCIVLLIPARGAGLTVLQSPAALRASPGDTVTLSCSFENRQGSVAKATWTRAPGAVLDSAHPFSSGRLRMSHLDLLQKGEATLTLSQLELRDSGLYQCQISIYWGESGTGAGTELLVIGRNQSDTGAPGGRELCQDSGPLFYRAVISLSLVVLFSLGIILSLRPWNGVPMDPAVGAGSKPPPALRQVSLI